MRVQRYVPEIQGLRGISILAVMLFHFGVISLPGGYTGVDMFFVISGYVITQLILREHREGTFTLGRFYKNRVVRLLPNLLAMIVVTTAISYALLLPPDFMQFGKSLQFTSVYLTNMVFARQQGYFDLSREVKPLLHTWSLSIEEQFYLFFPLLLLLAWRFGYSRWMMFGSIFLASLGWKVWVVQHDSIAGFFSFPGRIWEFMIGVMAAQVSAGFRQRFVGNEMLSLISIVLIALSFALLDERIAYAGLWVAIPCLATAMLIIGSSGTRVGEMLSNKQLVFVGTLSYSLYLWHWPLLVALRNLDWIIAPLTQLILLCLATFAVAYVAWRYIEAPFHHRKDRYAGKHVGWATFGFAIFVISTGGYIYTKEGMEGRFPSWVKVRQNLQEFDFNKTVGVNSSIHAPCNLPGGAEQNLRSCVTFGDAKASDKFLIIGDSHVPVWAPAFDVAAQRKHKYGIYSSLPGCPPVLGVHSLDVNRDMCEPDLEAKLVRLIAHFGQIKTVYLVAHWNMYAEGNRVKGVLQRPSMLVSDMEIESLDADKSKQVIEKAFRRTLRFFNDRGIRVVVVHDVPTLPTSIQNLPDGFVVPLEDYRMQGKFMAEMDQRLGGEGYSLWSAHPGDVLCAAGACITKQGNNYFYQDNNHLSAAAVAQLVSFVHELL